MKKKILIFVQGGVGGAERMSVLIGKNLDPDLFEVCFCLIVKSTRSSIADFIPSDMRIKYIPKKNPFSLILRIVTTIIKEKPYAVFSSVFNLSNKILPFRFLFPKVKVIIRCDNYLYTYSEKQQKIVSKLYPKADCIIAQTEEMRDELLSLPNFNSTKVISLHNPIDTDTINSKIIKSCNPYPNNGKKHFVASGRFAHQKGFDLLIKAFSEVRKRNENCDLYIIGDFEYGNRAVYNKVISIATDNGLNEDVHCVGFQKNPYPFVKYADCFVLSSRWEGLPNVLIESLYLGTPAAAFKCIPVIERIIEDGVSGYCAEKENVLSLSNVMIKTLELGRIKSNYKSAKIKDFTDLF